MIKIKCSLGDKNISLTPKQLVETDEDTLIKNLICSGCNCYKAIDESRDYMYYSECLDKFYKENENIEIEFELEEE